MGESPGHGGPLTDTEIADLHAALDDEYRARATYAQVLADFGEVRPFANIVAAESRHVDALVRLFERYGVEVPPDPWPGRVEHYASLAEACAAGVAAEVENAGLYDRLLAGTDRADVLEVYGNLRSASQDRHLPAFRRCVERGGAEIGDDAIPADDESRGSGPFRRRRRRRRGD